MDPVAYICWHRALAALEAGDPDLAVDTVTMAVSYGPRGTDMRKEYVVRVLTHPDLRTALRELIRGLR